MKKRRKKKKKKKSRRKKIKKYFFETFDILKQFLKREISNSVVKHFRDNFGMLFIIFYFFFFYVR